MGNNIGANEYQGELYWELYWGEQYQGEQHRELHGGNNTKEINIGNFMGGTMPRRTT